MSHHDFAHAQSIITSQRPTKLATIFQLLASCTAAEQHQLSDIFPNATEEFTVRTSMPGGITPDEARGLPAGNTLRRAFEVKKLIQPKSCPTRNGPT